MASSPLKAPEPSRYIDMDFEPSSAIAAGTIGTRGWQGSQSISSVPKSIVIISIADSSRVLPMAFYYNGAVYCNIYRSVSSEIGATFAHVIVRVYY